MSNRWRRQRPIPILDDVVRGRGGVAGGAFNTNPSDTPDYDFYEGYLQDENGNLITANGGKIAI